jgi:hypothetical protein
MNNLNQSNINNTNLENDIDISKININGDDNFNLPEMPTINNSKIKESKEDKDKKMIENIIKVCDNKFKNAVAQFKNYQIVESKKI